MAYIGIHACGCALSATVDNPAHTKDVAKDVRGMVKTGHVERVTVEEARTRLCLEKHSGKKGCPHPGQCPKTPQPAEEKEE